MELDSELLESLPLRKVSAGSFTCHQDPIGNHIIELREFYRTLEEKLEERKELANKEESSGTAKKKKIPKLNLTIPKFPKPYPFSHTMKELPENKRPSKYVKCSGNLPNLKEARVTFIEKILLQTGFCFAQTEDEANLINYLSDILDVYLKKFADRLHYNKAATNSGRDLMSPLETTLRSFGIAGIHGLHTFYYENVVKKHDILYKKCEDLYNEYKSIVETPK